MRINMHSDEWMEERANFHTVPGDTSDRYEPHWLTCTLCGRQSPPVNNGDDCCPFCSSETVYLETEAEYNGLIESLRLRHEVELEYTRQRTRLGRTPKASENPYINERYREELEREEEANRYGRRTTESR